MTDEIPMPYRRTTWFCWGLLLFNGFVLETSGQPYIDELKLIVILNVIIWSYNAHYAYWVLNEFKTILGIDVFTIKQKPEETGKSDSKKVN